ncbi:MAG: F0F1 ATP synthase subunit delta [Burkholderiales bacterium]
MAEAITVARPYAEAVYQSARQGAALERWHGMLRILCQVAADPRMRARIDNPRLGPEQIYKDFCGVCGEQLDVAAKNLLRVLAQNQRLTLLPQILELFEQRKARQEGVLDAHIASAYALDDAQVRELVSALQRRFSGRIEARVSIDASLIGGVKIIIGDEVVDASVSGKLQAMALALTA